jgi:hypothetical protein
MCFFEDLQHSLHPQRELIEQESVLPRRGVLSSCAICLRKKRCVVGAIARIAIDKSKKDDAKKAKIVAGQECSKAKQDLFHSLIKRRFKIKTIPRDGDCLFNSFLSSQKLHKHEALTLQQVRNSVAKHLIEKIEAEGQIPHQV